MLRSGLPWEMLPAEMGCGSGMSCWRRLRDWQAAGVWARLHQVLLKRMHAAGEIDWGRASLDGAAVPAKKGGLPPARTRRTGASRAQSATSSPTPAARRST
ncbi:transposase [Methylorubrum thiocyanatum]|uniref:Transposase n=1 Tax=Methylorubrum thiocyanatum TaxID=47958 RepID=A0AA40S852_9HYPH|nr:transposase [Methylorubrum thiocyanatum]